MVQLPKSSSSSKLVALMVPALAHGRSVLLPRGATTNATCGTQFSWMQNSQGQSPCLLASILSGACSTGNWNVPPVNSSQEYNPPSVAYANYCSCSWAVYNLLEACTACQGINNILNWDPYSINCENYLTNTAFPTDKIIPPNNTLIPYWSAINPTTWTSGQFNVAQAQSTANGNHSDINLSNPTSTSKKSTPTGAIAGGVVGGVVGVILIGVAIFFFSCHHRKDRKGKYGPRILDPSVTKLHERTASNTSQQAVTLVDTRYTPTPSTVYTSISPSSGTVRTHFGSVDHSLPYDVSLITNMANSPSPPPQSSMTRMSVQPMMNGVAVENPENVISPFTLTSVASPPDRKRPDGGIYPIYEEPNSVAASRRRLNPPTYNESVSNENGESSLLSPSSPSTTYSVDRKRRAHEPQNSVDSTNSATTMTTMTTMTTTPGNRESMANSDTLSLRTHVATGSVSGLDDAMTQLGFRAPSVIAAGSTAISSSLGANRYTMMTESSVPNADEVA
ncbi:hypothetical protein F5887DRAFT_984458 [Amanita rubescens]|nr:hypothetical protein F5887DRAFT_984458 [Amanita rubescens]